MLYLTYEDMQLLDCSAISDPDIREVYSSDILRMSRMVQAKFGILPFLFEGNLSNVTGFYEFRVWSLDKNKISTTRRL